MSAQQHSVASKKSRILVVDDSRVMRKAISRILEPEFELIETEDGEAGWEALAGDPTIEMVITDVEMPRLDGHQLLTRIRGCDDARIRALPAVIITGAEDEPAKQKAFASGATDFITKPIDRVQLLARAHAYTKHDEAARTLVEAAAALQEQASKDPLTQLYNRRFFLQRGTQDISFARRHSSHLSLIRIDIDNFKTIFAQYGDQTADEILTTLARLLMTKVRHEDTAGRIGGAEFAILSPSSQRLEAKVLAERLRAAVEAEPFMHENERVRVTVSIGVAAWSEPVTDIDMLLTLADKQLKLAKGAGGNQIINNVIEDTPTPAAQNGAQAASATVVPTEEPMAPPASPTPSDLTLDQVLNLLQDGDAKKLEPYLAELTLRVLPLIELCNKRLGLGLGFAIDSLREKLTKN